MLVRAAVASPGQTFPGITETFTLRSRSEFGVMIALFDDVIEKTMRLHDRILLRTSQAVRDRLDRRRLFHALFGALQFGPQRASVLLRDRPSLPGVAHLTLLFGEHFEFADNLHPLARTC